MFCNFTTTTHAKWILAGEHAVLRGHGALVFPLKARQLMLNYTAESTELNAQFSGQHSTEMHLLFWSVLQEGYRLLGLSLNQLHGLFKIDNNIPVGVGMGASAALCVAMARWFVAQNLIHVEQLSDFAKNLEHLFHGQSSGLDIAGVNSSVGIFFQSGKTKRINQTWQPNWRLSSSGQVGITAHCIEQVQTCWDRNAEHAKEIDKKMSHAVNNAIIALERNDKNSIQLLTEAINAGYDCFNEWHLINENLSHHIQQLRDAGAIAVKPTGSGGGGFVLSLWNKPPEATNALLPFELIKL